jgi:hypothetical protein
MCIAEGQRKGLVELKAKTAAVESTGMVYACREFTLNLFIIKYSKLKSFFNFSKVKPSPRPWLVVKPHSSRPIPRCSTCLIYYYYHFNCFFFFFFFKFFYLFFFIYIYIIYLFYFLIIIIVVIIIILFLSLLCIVYFIVIFIIYLFIHLKCFIIPSG